MALNLTYREHQLVQAFRACDERGKQAVERFAQGEAQAGKPPGKPAGTQTPHQLVRIK